MRVTPHPLPGLLERGIWKAPWMGPDGEIVLLVITSERKLLGPPTTLPKGSDYLKAMDALWELLDHRDPVTPETVAQMRRRSIRVV